jgi:hypothetical protein
VLIASYGHRGLKTGINYRNNSLLNKLVENITKTNCVFSPEQESEVNHRP